MPTKVIEFKSRKKYEEWLEKMGNSVKIIDVNTTKRYSLTWGFLGDTKTYTITYEELKNNQ